MFRRILVTVFALMGMIVALPLPGVSLAPVAAYSGTDADLNNELDEGQQVSDTSGDTVESTTVSLSDESYHVEFTESDLRNTVKAIVKLPNGEKVSYGSTWKGFVPDQVLANAIGRKHRVAQAVAMAAGANPPVILPQIAQTTTTPDKPVEEKIKPVEKPNVLPSDFDGDGSGSGGASGTVVAGNITSGGSASATASVSTAVSGSATVSDNTVAMVSAASNAGPGSLNTGPGNVQIRFTAVVNGTGTNMWVIGNTPVAIDSNTRMLDNPAFGAMVEVIGFQQANTIAIATQIRNLHGGSGSGGTPVRFTATVEDIGSASWAIGGFTVAIDANTLITGDPREGETAEVRAIRQAGTTLLATEIRILSSSGSGSSITSGPGGGGSGSGSGSSGSSGTGSGSSGSGSGSSGSLSGSSGSGSGSGSSGSGSGSSGSGSGSSGSGSGSSGSGSGSSGSGSGSSGSGS